MLKRLYVDNYKSLVNFEFHFNTVNLFLGENGSGKSSVFEVLRKLRALLVDKSRVDEVFRHSEKTRWQTRTEQRFELELEIDTETYVYTLTIEYTQDRLRIGSEQLEITAPKSQILLSFEKGEAQLYRDNASKGPSYPSDWSRSTVAAIPERNDNTKLTKFKERLAQIMILHPVPVLVNQQSTGEIPYPSAYLEDYVSWLRYLVADGNFQHSLTEELREVIPHFVAFSFEQVGKEERLLQIDFRDDTRSRITYTLGELSDGQRMLMLLYTLLYLPEHRDYEGSRVILCLDEPENFVALREIQPWLQAVLERCQDGKMQLILITHHPEIINYLLMPDDTPVGYWFSRDNLSPVRVKPIDTRDKAPISEYIARGWLSDE